MNALQWAAERGNTDMIQNLAERGVDVNAISEKERLYKLFLTTLTLNLQMGGVALQSMSLQRTGIQTQLNVFLSWGPT